MSEKQQIAKFRTALNHVFSRKVERIDSQVDFDDKYQKLFKKEYEALWKQILSTKKSDILFEHFKDYLDLRWQRRANNNNVEFYKSQHLYLLMYEQSTNVDDDLLFETLEKLLVSDPVSDSHNSFRKRYLDLNPYYRRKIDEFVSNEKKRRMLRRTMLDLLRDEFVRIKKRPARSIGELYDFNPRPDDINGISGNIVVVRKRWFEALDANEPAAKEEALKRFSKALNTYVGYLATLGARNILSLFQARTLVQDPFAAIEKKGVPRSWEGEQRTLFFVLHAITAVQLQATALKTKLYVKNLTGFAPDEVEFFAGPLRRAEFRYKTNILGVYEQKFRAPTTPIAGLAGFLNMFLMTQVCLKGLDLVPLMKTNEIRRKWIDMLDLGERLQIAARREDTAKIEDILSDPRNEELITAMSELSSRRRTVSSGHVLGTETLKAGSVAGRLNGYGTISVAYIESNQFFVELSELKPYLFKTDGSYLADRVYAKNILIIHANTIGIVILTEAMFKFMGFFLPGLVQGGILGLVEAAVMYFGGQELEEQLAKLDPTFAKVVGFLLNFVSFRPRTPKLKTELLDRPPAKDASLLGDTLNTNVITNAEKGIGSQSKSTARIPNEDLELMFDKFHFADDVVKMNSGIPLGLNDMQAYYGGLLRGRNRIPAEWHTIISQCPQVRKLIEAAIKDPDGSVSLVKIADNNAKALPYKFQRSTMGSSHELWVKLNGETYKLDGIVRGPQGKWYIGESKFTYFDMYADEPLASFMLPGKRDPTRSFHYEKLDDKVLPQFSRYAKLADKFQFEGLAVWVNTDFLFQTFAQTTTRIKGVHVFHMSTIDAIGR